MIFLANEFIEVAADREHLAIGGQQHRTDIVPPFAGNGGAGGYGGTGLSAPGTSGNVLASNGTAWVSSPNASVSAGKSIAFSIVFCL